MGSSSIGCSWIAFVKKDLNPLEIPTFLQRMWVYLSRCLDCYAGKYVSYTTRCVLKCYTDTKNAIFALSHLAVRICVRVTAFPSPSNKVKNTFGQIHFNPDFSKWNIISHRWMHMGLSLCVSVCACISAWRWVCVWAMYVYVCRFISVCEWVWRLGLR